MNSMLVEYEKLTGAQREQLEAIELPAEQVLYAGDIFGSLNWLPSKPSQEVKGFALLIDGTPRGFFVLKHGAFLPFNDKPNVATLHGLMIDQRFQGQGHGKACMQALAGLAQAAWPDTEALMLSVDPANRSAHRLYLAMGWQDCGTTFLASEGYERLLVLTL